jgi:hypothetical protein
MVSFFSSVRQQHRNTDGLHDPPLVADRIAHVDKVVRSVGPTSVDGLAVFTSLEASNVLLLTVEAEETAVGNVGASGPPAALSQCGIVEERGGKEGVVIKRRHRILRGGGVVVVFRRRRLGCSTGPGATATPGRPARGHILI